MRFSNKNIAAPRTQRCAKRGLPKIAYTRKFWHRIHWQFVILLMLGGHYEAVQICFSVDGVCVVV
jgi:hypothetical protein